MVFNYIQSLNLDCDFISSINESTFIEKINTTELKVDYYNFIFCILDNYDLILSNSNNDEKDILFKKRVIDISSKIDEESYNFYDNMGYNPRNMKKKIIQRSLHRSMGKEKNISSLYYFNDLYNIHFVLVDLNKREYYETTNMKYDKKYLCFIKNKFFLQDNLPDNMEKKDIENSILNIDVKNIYKTYLDPISKYKINDLRDIASGLNISLKENNKNKTKNILYDEINMIKMNG